MSIQIIEIAVFLSVASKMFEASKAVVINEDYYPSCREISQMRIIEVVNSWYSLNIESYEDKYPDEEATEYRELVFGPTPPPPTAIQFLKWLKAIRDNIDHHCIPLNNQQAFRDVLLLDRLIKEASAAIIGQLPDYKAAKWDTYK